jgi:hypothetical protein
VVDVGDDGEIADMLHPRVCLSHISKAFLGRFYGDKYIPFYYSKKM